MIDLLKDVNDIQSFIAKYPKDTVIGAASVRAMPISFLKAFENNTINNILPVIFVKGIEYGREINEDYYNHFLMVKNRVNELYGDSKTLFEPIIYSNIDLWRLFNIRYANYIMTKYGILNTCITCKAYFTMVYIHLACLFNKRLVWGEKPTKDRSGFHRDKLRLAISKSDQMLAETFNVQIIKPMEQYEKLSQVQHIIGDKWYYLQNESPCLFEKNWFDINGRRITDINNINPVLDNYVYPVSELLIRELNDNFKINKVDIENSISDYLKMKEMILC